MTDHITLHPLQSFPVTTNTLVTFDGIHQFIVQRSTVWGENHPEYQVYEKLVRDNDHPFGIHSSQTHFDEYQGMWGNVCSYVPEFVAPIDQFPMGSEQRFKVVRAYQEFRRAQASYIASLVYPDAVVKLY